MTNLQLALHLSQEEISDTTKYEDHFTSRSSLIAISKSGRTVASEDVQNFLHAKERGVCNDQYR